MSLADRGPEALDYLDCLFSFKRNTLLIVSLHLIQEKYWMFTKHFTLIPEEDIDYCLSFYNFVLCCGSNK